MLYYNFKNYDEFKQTFGRRECDNGAKPFSNRILFDCISDKKILHDYLHGSGVEHSFARQLMFCKSNDEALHVLMSFIPMHSFSNQDGYGFNRICLLGDKYELLSYRFRLDENEGFCIDADDNNKVGYVRYINTENNRPYKMKAGRFIHKILENEYRYIPLPLMRYLEETFSREWTACTAEAFDTDRYTLVIDDDFESIYRSSCCLGNFGSCMVDDDNHTFYNDAVEAKAASLRDDNGYIVARCVIYTEAYDDEGNIYRLAERQYSSDKSDLLKLQLVNALIAGGHIDAYKRVGAGCSDSDDFIDINGQSLKDTRFHIECNLEVGDRLSYQDSFKWYDYGDNTAYNYDSNCSTDELNNTEGFFRENPDDYVYSDYHERDILEEDAVYVRTRDGYFFRSECVCINDEWYFEDDCEECEYCGETYYAGEDGDQGEYSGITGEYYCSDCCRDKAEEQYIDDNHLELSDYSGNYFPEEEMIDVYVYSKSFGARHIERWHTSEIYRSRSLVYYNGDYYLYHTNGAIPKEYDLSCELEMWAA